MDWFYEKDGEQKGPVSESTLRGLLADGTIRPTNLVWREGMADWLPYASALEPTPPAASGGKTVQCPTCGAWVDPSELIPAGSTQVCPHCREDYAQGLREGLRRPVGAGIRRGTGGQSPNAELRAQARAALSGTWGLAVLVTLVFWGINMGASMVPLFGTFIQWAIWGPLALGMTAFFMGLHRAEPVEVGTIFSGFSRFGQALGIYLVTSILIYLATFAAAIPGIILIFIAMSGGGWTVENEPMIFVGILVGSIPAVAVSIYMYLRYALVYYIANDHPDIGVFMAIKRSTHMMDGYKYKLFALYCSFIGWLILGTLAFFVGLLWPLTYMSAATAAFYDDLADPE